METMSLSDRADAGVNRMSADVEGLRLNGRYVIECRDKDGNLKWRDRIENLITNGGKDHALDVTLSGGTQVATWYIGLTDGTPTAAAADTMASHAGWTEVTGYDEAARQAFVDGGVSAQRVTNSASKAVFTASGAATVGGCFLVSDSTKGGTTGTLFSVGAFSGGDKALAASDTLSITYTCSAS